MEAAVPGRSQPAPDWQVLVLADRGLYSRDLFQQICALGWPPLLRVQKTGTFRPQGGHGQPLPSFVPKDGSVYRAKGVAFRSKPLSCTLLAYRAPGCDDDCPLLTDLPPDALDADCGQACWYCLRAWIKRQFKLLETAGSQWQKTRMTHPRRAERLWLALYGRRSLPMGYLAPEPWPDDPPPQRKARTPYPC